MTASPVTSDTAVREGDLQRPAPAATRPAPRRFQGRLGWVGATLLLFAGSRVVSTAIIFAVIAQARPTSRIGKNSDFFDALTAWDGQWYHLIAISGYPTTLPVDVHGVAQNAWAFLPAYPYLVRLLAGGAGADWPVMAVLVSAAFGFGASVLLAALLRPHVGTRGALVAVALFAFSPVGFVLQAAYAESMGLCILFAVLLLIDRRKHLAAIPLVVLLAYTRPGLQALALMLGLVIVARLFAAWRQGRPLPWRETAGASVLLAVSAAGGWFWPWTAAIVTGQTHAYLDTEIAWRYIWTGTAPLTPITSWFIAGYWWFGKWGPLILAVGAAITTLVFLSRPVRRLGVVAAGWSLAYLVYLVAVFFPQSSLVRIVIPTAPLGGALGRLPNVVIALLVTASVLAQGVWAFAVYGYWPRFWSVL